MSVPPPTASKLNVSRETFERLGILVRELERWQQVKNLVGPRTLEEVWTRHVADGLQLLHLAPDAERWVDLGTGAGFPGLVIAAALADRGGATVHLIESNGRKCSFLRHAARLMEVPAQVHEGRIEALAASFSGEVEVVTARALAPLPQLLAWSHPLLTTGAIGLFPKGRGVAAELTAARESWRFQVQEISSRTDPEARILVIAPGSVEKAS